MLSGREHRLLVGVDVYTTKSVKAKKPLDLVDKPISPADASTSSGSIESTNSNRNDRSQLDRAALLEYFDGDIDLLSDIAKTFPSRLSPVSDGSAALPFQPKHGARQPQVTERTMGFEMAPRGKNGMS